MILLISILLSLNIFINPSSTSNGEKWGQIGHRAIGYIAEDHLNEEVKVKIDALLGNESLAEVSTWMDEVRSDDSYNFMAPWHYVTIPPGQNYEETEKAEGGDIIWAIRKVIGELKAGNLTTEQEVENIKVLVHLVGDIHQPMHVGNGDDRGGNDVRVEWFYEPSNLHRVWDTEMIDSKQLSFTELAMFVHQDSPQLISKWQNSSVLDWAYESKDYLPQAYDLPRDKQIGYEYMFKNWDVVQLRIFQAGVRLAAVLNDIYGE